MLIVLLAFTALGGQDPASAAPVIVNPSWERHPAPHFPQGGAENVNGAEVVANCAADAEGRVSDCRIESESPAGYGFGREVVASTSRARLATGRDAIPQGARIRFTTRFSPNRALVDISSGAETP